MTPNPEIQFTAEQRAAIEAPFDRFTITASAGAGKTSVLTARYIRHVTQEGLTPDQILTITFTRKAAAEMKRRIVGQLIAAGRREDAQIAESGPIQTIQSFCGRLLRENAIEAAVDPRFDELSERTRTQLMRDALRLVISQDFSDSPDVEDFIRKTAGNRTGYNRADSPYSQLESAIENVVSKLRAADLTRPQVRALYADPLTLNRHWEQLIVAGMPEPVRQDFEMQSAGNFDQRVKLAYKSQGLKVPAWCAKSSSDEGENLALRDTCVLVRLACDTWARFDAVCDHRQTFDYAAIERKALGVLRSSPETAGRLRRQYRVMMVDEAQDVNPVQYALFDALNIARVMYVGDAKQSIYGFRDADVRLFQSRSQSQQTQLTKNHRSEMPGILKFVDRIFARLWKQSYSPMAEPEPFDLEQVSTESYEGVELWLSDGGIDATVTGIAELLKEGISAGELGVLFRSAVVMEAVREGLAKQGIAARISGASQKFFTRLEVRDLANALRAVADPYDDFSLLATLYGPFAGLSLDSVVLLATDPPVVESLADFIPPNEQDVIRLARFLTWFEPLRAYADRLSAWEVIAELFAKTQYLEVLAGHPEGDRQIANARKLLMMASQEPLIGPLEYAELIRETQILGHREGDAPYGAEQNLVTLSTIHSSKGLEYPVVVLAETNAKIDRKPGNVLIDPGSALVATNFNRYEDARFRHLNSIRSERGREEEQRVLYVALTRAKRRLCVVLFPPSKSLTLSGIIQGNEKLERLPGIRIRGAWSESPSQSDPSQVD